MSDLQSRWRIYVELGSLNAEETTIKENFKELGV